MATREEEDDEQGTKTLVLITEEGLHIINRVMREEAATGLGLENTATTKMGGGTMEAPDIIARTVANRVVRVRATAETCGTSRFNLFY